MLEVKILIKILHLVEIHLFTKEQMFDTMYIKIQTFVRWGSEKIKLKKEGLIHEGCC